MALDAAAASCPRVRACRREVFRRAWSWTCAASEPTTRSSCWNDTSTRRTLAGLPWVRVIHGHGTGALKKAVRSALKGHALVDDFEAGRDGEGGDGVTVVKLAQSG